MFARQSVCDHWSPGFALAKRSRRPDQAAQWPCHYVNKRADQLPTARRQAGKKQDGFGELGFCGS